METFPHSVETEPTPEITYAPPVADILKDPAAASELWPDYARELLPQIEQRQQIASSVDQYLDNFYQPETITAETQQAYWQATGKLLQDPDYERIALFLPFESFPNPEDKSAAAQDFRQNYLEAWQNLLFVQDVRANFNDGDVLEVDARPSSPKRVVKAAHLTPFLIKSQFIQTDDILEIMESGASDLLCQSFLDTLPMMQDLGQVNSEQAARFATIQQSLPTPSTPPPPKYISEARRAWLAEKANSAPRPTEFTENLITLGQPLSSRIENLQSEIQTAEELATQLDLTDTTGVVLLGGSRLKGYGRPDSDLDLYVLTRGAGRQADIPHIPLSVFYDNPSQFANEVFDTIMVGEKDNIQAVQRKLAPIYFQANNPQLRKWNTERLEQDLLEYRLLQKGYARLCPDTNPEYKKYTQMDGQSAFYETGFRVIATKIYANSIFIPKISAENT